MITTSLTHWHSQTDNDGLLWLTLDRQGADGVPESMNVLTKEVLNEFSTLLEQLEKSPPRALIIQSGKSAGFIAGADINEFETIATAQEGQALVARGWHLYNRLAALPCNTVAVIRGHCMGGGTELALACKVILLVDEPGTRMGLPEVLIGIYPGWGGMRRLPKRIGPSAALDMMLTGKTIDAQKAKKLGLADECVPARVMLAAARQLALNPPPVRRLSLMQCLMNSRLGKPFVAAQAKKQVARRARREHYPAPYAIIDLWAKFDGDATSASDISQAVIESPTTRNLLRVFRLQERLKAAGKSAVASTQPMRLHVIGAGTMGGDIAAWGALSGCNVTLEDQSLEKIAPAIARAQKLFIQRRRNNPRAQRDCQDRLQADPQGNGVQNADIIIEAIFENLPAKQALFARLEKTARPDALLASNTSSLRLEDIRRQMQNPKRLIGIHFFNPVAQMPLVEIVEANGCDDTLLARAAQFVRTLDKLPLPVKSAPGFLVNAVLAPYMHEAMRIVDQGVPPATVDAAATAFGMPMGPCALIDIVGLDIARDAGKQLIAVKDNENSAPPLCLQSLLDQGHLGKKSGQGFYRYENGKLIKPSVAAFNKTDLNQITERLIAPLLNATQRLVDLGIVADTDLADAGVIFGTGFSPWTGGPLNYKKSK